MRNIEIENSYKDLNKHIENKELKEVFDILDLLLNDLQDWSLFELKRKIEETYHLMLKYFIDGIDDPEKDAVYRNLIISIYSLADKVKYALLLKNSDNIF